MFCDRYHWLPGNPLKLTLTLPDGTTFTAAPALATATASTTATSAFTFDDVALSPGVVARAAADCLQQPIRVSIVAVLLDQCLTAASAAMSYVQHILSTQLLNALAKTRSACSVVSFYVCVQSQW